MKYLPFLLPNLKRYGARQVLNITLLALAFALFAITLALSNAFSGRLNGVGNDLLIVSSKISQARLLPIRIATEVRNLPEVQTLSHASWFGGYYREPKNAVPLMAVDAYSHFDVNPAFRVASADLARWKETRNGLMIGRRMAEKFGIGIGQRFNLSSYLWRQQNGSAEWDFIVSGIYEVEQDSVNPSEAMFMHYDYLNGLRQRGHDLINVLLVRLKDERASEATAKKIDALFANSEDETRTSSVALLAQGHLARILNINKLMFPLVVLVVVITFLIIATNMSNNVRHRLRELAILRAVGFSAGRLYVALLSEIALVFAAGTMIGLAAIYALILTAGSWLINYLPVLEIGPSIWMYSAILAILLSLMASILPAVQMMRLDLVEQLQQ
jgi:putative ABC transport system permease protein